MRVLVIGNDPHYLTNMRAPLLSALVARGHEVHAATPGLEGEYLRRAEALGVRGHPYPLERQGTDPLADVRTVASLARLVRRIGPDVVFTYTIKPLLYGSLAAAIGRVPRRVAMITGLGTAFAADRRGLRQRAVHVAAREMYRQALRAQHVVFFQNPDDEATFRRLGLLRPGADVRRVNGSGVDLERFPASPPPSGPPVFTLVARLHRQKGIREFAAAAARVRAEAPTARFVLVGPTEDHPDAVRRDELDRWIADGVLEVRGFVDDVRGLLRETSVYVLPSYYPEGTPRSTLEALATGRAVVTTDAPGCRETVVEGENGFLVPVRDADALAAALLRFVRDPDLVPRMGAASRHLAERRFDAREVTRALIDAMGL